MKENKKIISERKPADRAIGQHVFKGVRYDTNGNPIYTCDSLSDDRKREMGWRYSPKHGLHGQISDPTKIHETKKVIKLNESQLRQIIRENLDEFIDGIRPGVRRGHKNFDIKKLFNEIEITLEKINFQCEHLEKLSRQIPDNDFEEELFEFAANMVDINRQAIDKFWEATKGIPFNESQLRKIIKESVKKVLKEGYLNDGDQDIREILANLAYNAIKQVCPQCAEHFTPLGGNGNSCGVYVLLSPYDMELSDKSQQKLEQWTDEQKNMR